MHNRINIALVPAGFINVFRLLLGSPGLCRSIGHHSDGEISHTTFAMHKLHNIIHAEAARHAVITLTVNELPVSRINPTCADQCSIGVRAGSLQVGTDTSLAIAANNPT